MKRNFYVKAIWDDTVNVWTSETDIEGLFIETATLSEFEEIMPELAREMIIANHRSDADIANRPLKELAAIIEWTRPTNPGAFQ